MPPLIRSLPTNPRVHRFQRHHRCGHRRRCHPAYRALGRHTRNRYRCLAHPVIAATAVEDIVAAERAQRVVAADRGILRNWIQWEGGRSSPQTTLSPPLALI